MSPKSNALEFRDVGFSFFEGGQTFNLKLRPGELAHIRLPGRGVRLPIANVAHGTQFPRSGEVLFEDLAWTSRGIRRTESARKRIGRVFDSTSTRACWVQNLNVTENALLAQSLCPKHTRIQFTKRAEALAEQFGLERIPPGRPAVTTPHDLAIAQWIRAFLPDPLRLLILEFPTAEAPDAAVPALLDALDTARENGTAALWIGGASSVADATKLSPDHSFIQTSQGTFEKLPMKG